MPDDDKLTPAERRDLADAIAFALKFSGRKRVHDSDALMADIVADRIVRHLEQSRYVVMKKPPTDTTPPRLPEGWPHTPNGRRRLVGLSESG